MNEYEKRVEGQARAIDPGAWPDKEWSPLEWARMEGRRDKARKRARDAMAEHRAAGYALVPVEATEEMVAHACPNLEALINAQAAVGEIPCAQVPIQTDMRRAGIKHALKAAIAAGDVLGGGE